ncbi:diphosphomevalonate decarboxylase [Leguminivora glycinivorella]|uniref:diphosphomevalonate decarboxylase n=1 Tax=Leguminivora glycinivorella TaxID=1035111 RepID=UPI00200FBC81|nr:diphosphomevalonate decarboxylase [Leguminivora glycinivorella]
MSNVKTVIAPVNIAVIKYWGKRDEELILPLNDSVSATLDTGVMCAKTSVFTGPQLTSDEIWLNGKKESFTNKRLVNCLEGIKAIAAKEKSVNGEFLKWKVHVCSVNNFPTAAGLASSAAGYACLVTALVKLYNVKSDVSCVARLGSGSACRSVYGGFVQWHAGTDPSGKDSIATQIAEASHWPEMRALILVVGDSAKKTSSTKGMKITAETSELLKHRIEYCVPQRTASIIRAIKDKNFPKFAEITMKDSNQFHAVCLDSYPPFVYMTEVSHKIVEIIHKYNEVCGEVKVAYTFDAGPNACLYLLEEEVPKLISLVKYVFPSTSPNNFVTGLKSEQHQLSKDFLNKLGLEPEPADLLKYVIHTKVGEGPTEVTDGSHLLDPNGLPL